MAEVSPQESILHQRRDAINLLVPHTSKLTLPPSPSFLLSPGFLQQRRCEASRRVFHYW